MMHRLIRREDSGSAALIVWGSVCLSALRLSLETANHLILWHLYGRRTVAHYHLSIVRVKPDLVVSNGDILRGWGAYHYFIGVALWIPISFLVLAALFKHVTPVWWRQQSNNGGKILPGGVGIITLFVMFFSIPGLLPFAPAMAMGLAAAVAGLYWLRASTPENT